MTQEQFDQMMKVLKAIDSHLAIPNIAFACGLSPAQDRQAAALIRKAGLA